MRGYGSEWKWSGVADDALHAITVPLLNRHLRPRSALHTSVPAVNHFWGPQCSDGSHCMTPCAHISRANASVPERVGAVGRGKVCTECRHCAAAQSSLAPRSAFHTSDPAVNHFSRPQRSDGSHCMTPCPHISRANASVPERVGAVGSGRACTACRHCAAAPSSAARRRALGSSVTAGTPLWRRRQPTCHAVSARHPC